MIEFKKEILSLDLNMIFLIIRIMTNKIRKNKNKINNKIIISIKLMIWEISFILKMEEISHQFGKCILD